MEQQQYRSYAEGGRFDPIQQSTYIPLYRQRAQELKQASEQYRQAQLRNARVEVENAGFDEELKALSQFSTTLTKRIGEIQEQTKKDIETGEFYSALTADLEGIKTSGVSPEDTPEQQALQAEANSVSKTSELITQSTGDIAAGEAFRRDYGGIARGFVGEQAALMGAQTRYSGWVSQFLDSNEKFALDPNMTIREAANSGDSRLVEAALRQARLTFIKEHDLQYATKDNFVKYLGQTILSVDSSLAGNLVREGIKAKREEEVSRIEGLGYDLAGTTGYDVDSLQQNYNQIANLLYNNNTGLSRAQANEQALKIAISRYEDDGNVDAIKNLGYVLKVPGQAGTELSKQYGNLINDAVLRAEGRLEQIESKEAKDVEADMFRELDGAGTPEERTTIVERAIERHKANGNYKAALALQGQLDDLQVEGSNEYNAQQLQDSIEAGEASMEDVDRAQKLGQITRSQADALRKAFGTNSISGADKELSTSPVLKEALDSYVDRFDSDFLNAVQLKKDQYGQLMMTQTAMLSPGQAEVIRGAAKNEMRQIAARVLAQLPGGTSEAEKSAAIGKALQDWYKGEFKTKGGKYYVAPKVKGEWDADNKAYLKNLASSPVTLAKPKLRSVTQLRSADFSDTVKFGSSIPGNVRQSFRRLRGDKLFSPDEVKVLADQYNKTGTFQLGLIRAAQELGMSPLALLNQQISAHSDTLDLEPFEATPMSSGKADAPTGAMSGYRMLLQMGVPEKGAAYLSGNIQQESGWNGNRTWDDQGARAGGLVSWRAGRLERMQSAVGDVRTASTKEQLEYMMDEMRRFYPSAYRTFMNPRATDRQLMNASYNYWGYGTEGARFRYAQDIETQSKGRGRPPKVQGTAAERTVQVGQFLQSQGYRMWQHPNFNLESGYTPKGGQRVAQRENNSYHHYGEALDFPLSHNSEAQLDKLYSYFNKNKARLGVAELLWRSAGHYDHLHVSFK